MAGPGAKGGMFRKGSNGKRVLITKSMAKQMASAGMSAQTDEEYADQASKLREQNNIDKRAKKDYRQLMNGNTITYQGLDGETYQAQYKKGEDVNYLDIRKPGQKRPLKQPLMTNEGLVGFTRGLTIKNPAKLLKDEVQTLKTEVVNSDMPKSTKSRWRKLIDNLEELQQQDIQNSAKVFGIAARTQKISENLLGVDSNPDKVINPPKQLQGKQSKSNKSRFGQIVDKMEDLAKKDTENAVKVYSNTAKSLKIAETIVNAAEVVEPKKLKGKSKRKKKKPSKS